MVQLETGRAPWSTVPCRTWALLSQGRQGSHLRAGASMTCCFAMVARSSASGVADSQLSPVEQERLAACGWLALAAHVAVTVAVCRRGARDDGRPPGRRITCRLQPGGVLGRLIG